ncbi:MAG: glycine cleavage system aminomethyltransferase GcvT [Micromonosporaceae bacterium]|nr:glycine cleavage system aminomethyltransferase GcvT [Micromonosporaceae bacterium]
MNSPSRRSPLHDRHAALGAKLAPFGGWEMPLEYAHGGVIAEHTAVREAVGVFDVSHMGKARVTGPGAVDFLNTCLVGDLDRVATGRAQYTMCCDQATGGVVDDFIAYRHSDDNVFLVPNAANAAELVCRLAAAAPPEVTVSDEHERHAILAVQGPASERVLDELGLPADHDYMSFVTAPYAGTDVLVCRTGYTGEHGYELIVPIEAAATVWDAVLAAGQPYGIRPCGLGARDTLRTEAGLPLHGQDLSLDITPVQAGYSWVVGWSKPTFWGHDALRAERAATPRRQLRGLLATARGIPRPHMPVLSAHQQVGQVTSGTFSPTLQVGIALALLDTAAGLSPGSEVAVDVRGRRLPMRVVKPPFVRPSAR